MMQHILQNSHAGILLDQFLDKRPLVLQGLDNTCVTFAIPKSWHFGGPYFQLLPPTNPPGKVRIQDKSRSGCVGQQWDGHDEIFIYSNIHSIYLKNLEYIRTFIRQIYKVRMYSDIHSSIMTPGEYIRTFIR